KAQRTSDQRRAESATAAQNLRERITSVPLCLRDKTNFGFSVWRAGEFALLSPTDSNIVETPRLLSTEWPLIQFLQVVALALLAQAPLQPRLIAATFQWEESDGFRSAQLEIPSNGKAGFTLLSAPESGINFVNRLSEERSLTNQIYLNGSGVAAGDVDG